MTSFLDKVVEFSKKHPIWFWVGISVWILLPPPIDFIPVVDDLILAALAIIVGFKRIK